MTLIDDIIRAVDGFHRLEREQNGLTGYSQFRESARWFGGRGSVRTAATVSELISLLRNRLDTSSALVVPEQDQAMISTVSGLCPEHMS